MIDFLKHGISSLRVLSVLVFCALTACGSGNSGSDLTFSGNSENFAVSVTDRSNMSASQSAKLDKALAAAQTVMKSDQLRDKVVNFTYSGQKIFVQNNDLTNEQVYETLMAAAELYPTRTEPNGVADIKVKIYYPPWYSVTSAVAFTSTTDAYLNIYDSYFSSASIADLAETLIHEWTHKLGFDHDYDSTARRPYSVPYAVGSMVNTLARSL